MRLSPVHERSLNALTALIVDAGVGGELGQPELGVHLPPDAVPVQLLLLLCHRGPGSHDYLEHHPITINQEAHHPSFY